MKMIKNKIAKYPVVQLWRRTSSTAREYTKMNSEEIRLDAGNFTVNGVIQYQLSVILLGSIRIETYWEFTCITQCILHFYPPLLRSYFQSFLLFSWFYFEIRFGR